MNHLFRILLVCAFVYAAPSSAQSLELTASSPASYALTGDAQPEIRLSFSAPIDSVAPGSVRVLGWHSGHHDGEVSIDGSSLIFSPTRPFRAGERVRAAIRSEAVFASV